MIRDDLFIVRLVDIIDLEPVFWVVRVGIAYNTRAIPRAPLQNFVENLLIRERGLVYICLLYTSDAADE